MRQKPASVFYSTSITVRSHIRCAVLALLLEVGRYRLWRYRYNIDIYDQLSAISISIPLLKRWGIRGQSPPPWNWMPFCFCVSKESCKFAPLLIFAKVSNSHSEWMSHCLTTHLQRIKFTCCHVDHIHFQLPLNSDKFNLCSCAIYRFSFTAHRPNCSYTCPKK